MAMRKTGEAIPGFEFNLLNGGRWCSTDKPAGKYTLLTIYRGKWCQHCKHQLQELDQAIPDFESLGVSVLAVSADTQVRAESTAAELGLSNLVLGYEMPISSARELGVFISNQVKDEEMPVFCEPATFLIDAQSKVFAAWIGSNAFARTAPKALLDYVNFITEKQGRPPRGSA